MGKEKMNDWDLVNLTSGSWERPESPVAKFLDAAGRIYGHGAAVLDIGPGRSGRHSRLAEEMGFDLTAVDVSHVCRAHYHCDIKDFRAPQSYDVILDIKTLCQDQDPPYEMLRGWLKPGGCLFSMIPGEEHRTNPEAYDIRRHKVYEYAYMRMASEPEIREMLRGFTSVGLYKYIEPLRIDRGVKYLYSWCIEAQK